MELPLALAVAVLLVGAGCVVLLRKLRRPAAVPAFDPDWLLGFSIERYRPIERLLCEADYEFLRAQRGYRPDMVGKLRAARRRVFRAYLSSLSRDFNRLHTAARFLVLYSPQDRPDLASALVRQRILFAKAMMGVRCRLTLNEIGIGTVNAEPLMAMVDAMRLRAVMLSQPMAA